MILMTVFWSPGFWQDFWLLTLGLDPRPATTPESN